MRNAILEKFASFSPEFLKRTGKISNRGQQAVVDAYARNRNHHGNFINNYIIVIDVGLNDIPDMLNYLKQLKISKFIYDISCVSINFDIIKYFLSHNFKLSYIDYKIERRLGYYEEVNSGILVEM